MVREPHPSEAPAIAALLNAEAEARWGGRDVSATAIEEWFGYDDVDLRHAMAELTHTGSLGREGGLSAERPALVDRFLEDATEVDVEDTKALQALNPDVSSNSLTVGQRIRVKKPCVT